MSFYTSLSGLNGASADISAISNNIANVGTTGFKLSRAEFGDIFATSPLQNANSAVGSGTILKSIKQQFTQGNIAASKNALDLAISGQGFFALKPSATSTQTVYTRNGSFSVNSQRYVVDSQGQYLQVFPVNTDGSVIATGASSAQSLQLPSTSGLPKATSAIQLGLNLPADATIIPNSKAYSTANPYKFDRTNSATYNQSTSITIYDSLGNPTIATIYYTKTQNATSAAPSNKWMTHVFVGDKEVDPSLISAKNDQSQTLYINKFGQTTTDPTQFDSSFVTNQPSPLYYQDQQTSKTASTPAKVVGQTQNLTGFDFGDTAANKVTIITDPSSYTQTREGGNSALTSPFWGKDLFTISVDGSAPQSISINSGSYTGDELAAEMTRAVNAKFSDAAHFRITDTYRDTGGSVVSGNDVFHVALSKTVADGSTQSITPPLEIDLLGTAGSAGTPLVNAEPQQLNYQDLTRDQLIDIAQKKINEQLNERHNEFSKPANWVDPSNPPIKVGFDTATRSLTFAVDPAQLGADAALPANRYQNITVYNPTSSTNDLGIPAQTTSVPAVISANTQWSGEAVLPSGPPITAVNDQRTGITVTYNKETRQFVFNSGTTGEASKIVVGRSSLAQSSDILPQINSYDLSNLKLNAGDQIILESDGKKFTFTTPVAVDPNAVSPAITPSAFIGELQQSFPVSFSSTARVTIGTTTQTEEQKLTAFGNLLNADRFDVNLQLGPDASSTSTTTLHVGPLGPTDKNVNSPTYGKLTGLSYASTDTPAMRLADLAAQVQRAINDQTGTDITTTPVKVSVINGQLVVSYEATGAVTTLASIKQTVRGVSDGFAAVGEQATGIVSPTVTTAGNASTAHAETLTLNSIATMNAGDTYKISLVLNPAATPQTATTLTVGPLVGATPTALMQDLATKLNTALGSSASATYNATSGGIDLAWNANGALSIPTTVGLSGVSGLSSQGAIQFTDRSVNATPTIKVALGNAKTQEVQQSTFQPEVLGSNVVISTGDQYRVNVPMPDGSTVSKTITVGTPGPGQTMMDALVTALNGAGLSAVQFSYSSSTPNTLKMTYNAYGSIVGNFNIEQVARVVDPTQSPPTSVQVRPDPIGPFSLGVAAGDRLTVTGNPDGEPFRLNVQAAGIVQSAEAEGATGSKAQSGRQIGQSLAQNSNSIAMFAGNSDLLGIGESKTEQIIAGTGLASTAAVAYGAPAITPMNQTFLLNESLGQNKMAFTVDGITGTIKLPIRAYTGDSFAAAIQERVNQIQDPDTGRVVSGMTVKFDSANNRLIFTSGTTGSTSQINVVGPANFGLNTVSQTPGAVPTITNLTQATDANGNKLYVDTQGKITTIPPTSKFQSWSPIYLTPGTLTFDTTGKLLSPKEGVVYSPFDPGNGSNPLNLTIDYGKYSTQYTQPFTVQSLTQDGYTSGSLNGLNIDATGIVTANYSNGQTQALGKIIIANFANANGLKQVGNANYVATSVSGQAVLGQPGSDGLGSIQAGALESSNVDITEELVNLITAQRNFQANAKAIETDTTLTNTIIQIRS
jgi:flagellar hook-basal body protein